MDPIAVIVGLITLAIIVSVILIRRKPDRSQVAQSRPVSPRTEHPAAPPSVPSAPTASPNTSAPPLTRRTFVSQTDAPGWPVKQGTNRTASQGSTTRRSRVGHRPISTGNAGGIIPDAGQDGPGCNSNSPGSDSPTCD